MEKGKCVHSTLSGSLLCTWKSSFIFKMAQESILNQLTLNIEIMHYEICRNAVQWKNLNIWVSLNKEELLKWKNYLKSCKLFSFFAKSYHKSIKNYSRRTHRSLGLKIFRSSLKTHSLWVSLYITKIKPMFPWAVCILWVKVRLIIHSSHVWNGFRYFPKLQFPKWPLPKCAISQAATSQRLG